MEEPRKVYRVLVRVTETNKWDGPYLLPLSEISFRMGIAKGNYKSAPRPGVGTRVYQRQRPCRVHRLRSLPCGDSVRRGGRRCVGRVVRKKEKRRNCFEIRLDRHCQGVEQANTLKRTFP